MKTSAKLIILLVSFALLALPSFAQLSIPSDGSDGPLNITTSTNVDLSRAITGAWDANNAANAAKGIYDSNKWAVVFKYSSVNIASGATLTFSNHPSRAPVVWLVNGDVTIDGQVSLDGQDYTFDNVNLPEPGPGGFRGGAGAPTFNAGGGPGFGPGGYYQDHGSYSTYHSYGNPQIVPLIGGSGGGGGETVDNGSGGGGAILIAASGTITLNGFCHANGGAASHYGNYGRAGSGGAIRLVANQIAGIGQLQALAGVEAGSSSRLTPYVGRIRLEANSASPALDLNPSTVAVSPSPLVIWPAPTAPTVRVVSIDGQAAPSDPRARISAGGDDLTISTNGTSTILLQTSNFPVNGTVNVYIKPRLGPQSILPAAFVGGDANSATWQLQTSLPLSHTVIQARAVASAGQ